MSKLTDMTDFKIIPQVIEGAEDIVRKAKDEYVCNILFDLKIDKDVLENQLKEIHRLNDVIREYEELEEQGLLLKLPCKVGDTLWCTDNKKVEAFIVKEFKIFAYRFDRIEIYFEDASGFGVCLFDGTLDEGWFLTKEEAEKELKRMECAE